MSVGGSAFGAAAFGGTSEVGAEEVATGITVTSEAGMTASATVRRAAGFNMDGEGHLTAASTVRRGAGFTITTDATLSNGATVRRGAGFSVTTDVGLSAAAARTFGAGFSITTDVGMSAVSGQPYISLDLAPGPVHNAVVHPPSLTYTERPASVLDSICSNWITTDDLICDTNLSAEVVQNLLDTSVEWLNDMTCNQFGGSCLYDLRVTTMCHHGGGACGSRCDWDRIDLTRYLPSPVTSIAEVRVNGAVVPSTDYRLDDRRWLVPIRDGLLTPWPRQDMQLADGEDGTWKITAYAGQEPPRPLQLAATELTCQLIRRWETGVCDLPDNTTSVTRDGVTISMQARQEGKIGLPTVDSVVELYGCSKKRRLADVTGRRATSLRII